MGLTFADNATDEIVCGSGSVLDDLSTITVCAWIKPANNSNTFREFGGKGSAFSLFRRGVDGTRLSFFRGATTGVTVDITTGKVTTGWNFVAFTMNFTVSAVAYWGDETTVASDQSFGVNVGAGTLTSDASSNFTIGSDQTSGGAASAPYTHSWWGIWNRVLSLGEIKDQQYNPTITRGNVLWMRFDNSTTGTQQDHSGYANHGTVTGATVSTSAEPAGVHFSRMLNKATIVRPRPFKPGLPR